MPQITVADHPWQVIINPTAGSGLDQRHWQQIESRLLKLLPQYEVHTTDAPGTATTMAQQLVSAGARHILAVGGDGTNHEVVNGIYQALGPRSAEVIYALLPIGTGNDWIKTHQIPNRLPAWFDCFQMGNLRQQNLGLLHYYQEGQAQQCIFVNVIGLAYDGFIVQTGERLGAHQRGKWFYLWLTFRCLFQYTPEWATIQYDTKSVSDHFYTINIGIGKYSGGGMRLTPHARPQGKQLALTYARSVSKLGVLLATPRFYRGTLGQHPRIETPFARSISIDTDEQPPLLVEADGEFLGRSPIRVELLPNALTFIGPMPKM